MEIVYNSSVSIKKFILKKFIQIIPGSRFAGFILSIFLSCGLSPREKAVEILSSSLKDQSAIVRVRAAKGLVEIGDKRGIDVLYEALKSDDKEEVVAALSVLYDLEERISSPIVIQLSRSDNPLIRTEAYRLLSIMLDTVCKQILIKGTTDKIAKIRRTSYAGLEKFKDPGVIRNGLRDTDALTRISAAKALSVLGVTGTENFIRKELDPNNPNVEIWAQGVLALAEIQDTSVISFIKDLLVDTPWDLKLAAAEALLLLKSHDGVDVLKQALQSDDPFNRVKAVEILKDFPVLDLYDLVKEATKDRYINVSIGAVEALKAYHKKESQLIFEKLLGAPNPLLRISAATAYLSQK